MLKSFLHFILISVVDFSPSHWINGTVTRVYQPWRMDSLLPWCEPCHGPSQRPSQGTGASAPCWGQPLGHSYHSDAAGLFLRSSTKPPLPVLLSSFSQEQEDEIYSYSPSLHVLIPCSVRTVSTTCTLSEMLLKCSDMTLVFIFKCVSQMVLLKKGGAWVA